MWPILIVVLGALLTLLLLALGAVAVVVWGVVAAVEAMPWLLIVVGAWLLWRAARGAERERRARAAARVRPGREGSPEPASAQQRSVRQQPVGHQPVRHQSEPARPGRPRPDARPRRELPTDVQVKVEQIRRKADVLLGYADRFPPFSQDLHIVRQTAAEYLPRTVRAYLALPGDDDPVIATSGKTALQELREQLGLMDAKLDEITQALQRNDLDRLAANRRFLEERFDVRDGEGEGETRVETPSRGTDAA